jgi:Tannase and feruloyl esterase
MVNVLAITTIGLLVGLGAAVADAPAATTCEGLASVALAGAKVTSAETVAAGAFQPPANLPPWLVGDPSTYKQLPSFCRVRAEARPSADSDIKIEVWMPAGGWNGRLRAEGNGGFAGEIDYGGLADAVAHGYASAGTDTGHSASGTDARWALGHPEKVIDFGYRGIHEMTQAAKAAIKAFYGKDPQRSYFTGCSNGGRQALMEAQRFPGDYDGIVAGAPANFWSHLLTSALWDAQATTNDGASYIPPAKLPAIAHAVNDACDTRDGVTDGILNDPRQCRFDPAVLQCRDGDAPTCLTPPQVTALKKLYEGARDAQGRRIFPGFLPGAEQGEGGWGLWITGDAPGRGLLFAFANGFFANMVYGQPDWDYKTADLGQALRAAVVKTARTLDATEANLKPFKDRGGKMILYHGWNDPAISALNTIDYYDRVVGTMGASDAGSFVRLYMVPGIQHCAGGPGTGSFGQGSGRESDPRHNVQLAVEQWVETGTAPSVIVASRYGEAPAADPAAAPVRKMTRPLCPYPQAAAYKGSGDTNDTASFGCRSR